MTSEDNQQSIKTILNEEAKFKYSLDFLPFLKTVQGKALNFLDDYFLTEKEKLNKNKFTIEDRMSTSDYLNLLSNTLLYNNYQNYQKPSFSETSVFKPIFQNNIQFSKQIISYNKYNINFVNNLTQNINSFNHNLFNQSKLINTIPLTNKMFPLINQNISSGFPPPTQQVIPLKKSIFPIQIISKEKIFQNGVKSLKENNILLNKKRKTEKINISKNNSIKKNNKINNYNNEINNNIFFVTKKKKVNKIIQKIPAEKNLFQVTKKSKYVFKKRKPKKSEINIKNIKIACAHEGCVRDFKTKKQLVFHHYKMSIECHRDSIILLKMINSIKNILLKKDNHYIEKYFLLNKEEMNNISLNKYIHDFAGFIFEN